MRTSPSTLPRVLTAAALTAVVASQGHAQNRPDLPIVGHVQQLEYRSAPGDNTDRAATRLVAEKRIHIKGAAGLGLEFGAFSLGEGSLLELVSKSGESAAFDAETLLRNTHSPYFNGDTLTLRVWAAPQTRGNFVSVRSASVIDHKVSGVGVQTLCGSDSRTTSSDKRVARLLFRRGGRLSACTANLMSSRNCFTSAGHCFDNGASQHVVQFDVPASTTSGAIVNPPASKQWTAIGTSSTTRFQNTGIGGDWAVFLTDVNSTGLHPGSARGTWFSWTVTAPLPTTNLVVRGHGTDSTPSLTRNFTQQRASGPHVLSLGSTVRHRVDTTGGVSGAAIYYITNGLARVFGVHTNGGCNSLPTSFNSGTLLSYTPFRTALVDLSNRRGDLRIDAVRPSTTTLRRGGTYSVSVTTRNWGSNACVASNTGVYLSANSTISTGDTLLASIGVQALAPQRAVSATRTIRIPTNAQLGTCYLGALADRLARVAESSESNNARAVRVTCTGIANLAVTSWRLSTSSLLPKQQFNAQSIIRNIGTVTSAACTSALYFSSDSIISTTDILLTTFTTKSLAPQASHTLGHGATAPSSLPVGVCYVGIYADSQRRVSESSETDNTRGARVTCLQAVPDFAIASFTPSSTSLRAGRSITAKLSVTNLGNVSARSARHGLYLSADSTVTTGDTLISSVSSSTLAVRATQSLVFSGTVPSNVRSGTCYLGALLDSARAVSELNENNNSRVLRATCIGTPDFRPISLSVPSTTLAGSRIGVLVRLANVGGAATPSGISHAIMLSTNSTITRSDALLTRFTSASIAASSTFERQYLVQLPAHLPSGTYTIGVLADVDQRVTEVSEANNTAGRSTAMRAYTGTAKFIHFIPTLANAANNAVDAEFRLASGPKAAPMAITAPSLPSHLHLTLWSGSANYVQDFFTEFSLGLINSPLMPNWFGALDATGRRTNLALSLPQASGFVGYTTYTHVVFIKPDFSAIVAFSTNSVRNRIAP